MNQPGQTTPAWANILQECGWPTSVVVLDFETFFTTEFSLRKMPQIVHIMDPRFEVLCLAECRLSPLVPEAVTGEVHWNVDHYLTGLQMEFGEDLGGSTIVAHNASYEAMILAKRYNIFPRYMIDTLGLARHINARTKNDLAALAKRYGLPLKGDTTKFKDYSFRTRAVKGKRGKAPTLVPPMNATQKQELGEYAARDTEIEARLLELLLPCLSRPAVELPLIHHTLELATKSRVRVDAEYAADVRRKMEAELDRIMDEVECEHSQISGNDSCRDLICDALVAAGDTLGAKQAVKRDKKGKLILAMAKDDPAREWLLRHSDDRVRKLAEARVAIKSWPNHISRVNNITVMGAANDGMFPVPFKYHGAHTGRWSGDEGVNAQNLSSKNEIELVNQVRGILVPQRGQRFAIMDFSAIEARGVAWIAGQTDLCEMFRRGVDTYCHYAGLMARRPVRKPEDDDPPPVAKWYKRMRNMGKIQVLGGGYGMGPDKCQGFADSSYNIQLTADEAYNLIHTYRKSVPNIVLFWSNIERAFKYACKYGQETQLDRGLRFWKAEGTTVIQLPSGRTLKYEGAEVRGQGRDEHIVMPDPRKPGYQIYMWGGVLTENVVQAFCRDLLAEALLELERLGYPVAFHVHDELICPTTPDRADETMAVMTDVMSRSPAWGPDFPVGCEGVIADRYGGH